MFKRTLALTAGLALSFSAFMAQAADVLRVSAIPDEAPTELLRKFEPLGAYLEQQLGSDAKVTSPTTYSTVGAGSQILRDLGVRKMRVMSSPMKFNAISGFDLEVVEYLPSE